MPLRYDTVSLLTDLGTDDEQAGVLRAVVRDLAPHVQVVDLTHGITPFDIRAGALALVRAIAYVPAGVVVASIDPTVGSSRRAIAVEVAGGEGVVIGPDNGLLAPAIALTGGAGRAVVLTNTEYHLVGPGATFAARDIFVPAAAHLCNGVDLAELGESVDAAVLLPSVIPLPQLESGVLNTEVLWVDRFGNVQLNVGPDDVIQAFGPEWTRFGEARFRVTIGDDVVRSAVVTAGFDGLGTGALGLVVDSSGMFALTMEQASAAAELRVGVTDRVRLEPLSVEAGPTPDPAGSISIPVTLRPGPTAR